VWWCGGKAQPTPVRVNKIEGGGWEEGIKNKHKGRFHEKTLERGVWYFIYTYAYVYEPQHKTNGWKWVREKNTSCETRGIEDRTKREQQGRDFDHCGGVEDKVTERAQTKKGASWKTISREGGRL